MKSWIFIFFIIRASVGGQDIAELSDLPFAELLAEKKFLGEGNPREGATGFSALEKAPLAKDVSLKKRNNNLSGRKTFYEDDYEDEKKVNKKGEHKMDDILNTSIMALSYLAFGGYLLCMITNALRKKRRRFMMVYPPGITFNNQFAQILQHHMIKPEGPFIKFPTVTVHQGGKKRRRHLNQSEAPWGEPKESSPFFSITDYIDTIAHDGN